MHDPPHDTRALDPYYCMSVHYAARRWLSFRETPLTNRFGSEEPNRLAAFALNQIPPVSLLLYVAATSTATSAGFFATPYRPLMIKSNLPEGSSIPLIVKSVTPVFIIEPPVKWPITLVVIDMFMLPTSAMSKPWLARSLN